MSARFDRDLLEEVINRTGCREKRSRRLSAHVMIRYVIAMGLFFDESYDEVTRRLVGSLHRLGSWVDDWQVPAASAIAQARTRLGVEPMRALFERAAVPVAGPGTKGAWLARRRLTAIDATSFDVASTSPPRCCARPGERAAGTVMSLGGQPVAVIGFTVSPARSRKSTPSPTLSAFAGSAWPSSTDDGTWLAPTGGPRG